MPEVEEPKQPRVPTEEEIVTSNVEFHLRAMGFNTMQAEALAKAHVDWHRALFMIQNGCDHETAVHILL
jgi:hypothetical protein